METINITEDQRKELSYKVAQLVFELKKDERVGCIYFMPHKYNEECRVLNIFIATKAPRTLEESKLIKDFESQNNKEKDGFEIRIITNYDYKEYSGNLFATTRIPDRYYVMGLEMFNATILYDRNGKYRDLKEKAEVTGIGYHSTLYTYDNLASIVPPIEERIDGYLEDMESMNNREVALKKFTKSDAFTDILKM